MFILVLWLMDLMSDDVKIPGWGYLALVIFGLLYFFLGLALKKSS